MAGKLTYKQKLIKDVDKNYSFLRKTDYPSMEDQLDMLYWDMQNGTTNWQDTITKIKGKYSKPAKITVTIEKTKPRRRRKKK